MLPFIIFLTKLVLTLAYEHGFPCGGASSIIRNNGLNHPQNSQPKPNEKCALSFENQAFDLVCPEYCGGEVDRHFGNNYSSPTAIRLTMHQSHFPNEELASNWYVDQTSISYIMFTLCNLRVINRDAFDVEPLRNLAGIYFNGNPQLGLEFRMGAFNGLTRLRKLYIKNTKVINPNYGVMGPIANSLEVLTIMDIDVSTNIYNFVGGPKLTNLQLLSMREMPFYRIITPHSITRTPKIIHLLLSRCGVEAIMLGSFNHIIHTLDLLLLMENKLKTLPADLIDGKYLHVGNLYLNENPWICDCSLLHAHERFVVDLRELCESLDFVALKKKCVSWNPPVQWETTNSRNCFDHFGTNTFRINYTINCALTFNSHNRILYVKCAKRSAYYILLSHMGHQRPLCFPTTAKYAAFSIEKFSVADGVLVVSIIDPSAEGKVWPFHIISMTIQTSTEWISAHDRALILTISIIVSAAVFIIFALVGICVVVRNPILLKGVNRVVLVRDNKSNQIGNVLVMPRRYAFRRDLDTSKFNKSVVEETAIRSETEDYVASVLYIEPPDSPKYYDLDPHDNSL